MMRRLLLSLLTWACCKGLCQGHGIVAVRVAGGVGVQVAYDDGTPVSFSDVKVFAPDAGEKATLTGMTDRNGCFLFLPDTGGVWRVTVDDGMGHAVTHDVSPDGWDPEPVRKRPRIPKRDGVVVGLALIFGVFGWASFLRLRTRCGAGA